jgi:thymidylate synthase ThyX
MENVKLVSVTPDAEKTIAYCARVSNPNNQDTNEYAKLLRYCILHGHWSIFEMANMVLEINTTRGIAAQILRHRSFSFQEFSQRYADASYMNGTIRSWIHYINLREGHGTQKEHMDVANQCKDIFIKQLPVVSEALGWNENHRSN